MAVLTTGRLPVRLTPLVGRDAELGELTRALTRFRLLTLTGPGGTGKTRLALAATTQASEAADVAWVELAPMEDPLLIAPAVAARLGVPETPGTDPVTATAVHLAARHDPRPVLVVLDNCEHLTAEVASLAEQLLGECPALSILATSREPLGVEGERSWPVPPLERGHAVALFEERARRVAPSFSITDSNRQAVAQVCARLDGLPLAIELAAARMRVLSIRQLAERLDNVFGVLTGGARSAPLRHQALRATLDWSHDLLTDQERAVFRRLATFSDGFTLAAAEQVVAFGDIPAHEALDLLSRLADKSLLRVENERYYLLATIREYAAEKLARAGERDQARAVHLAYFTGFAEQAGARVEQATAHDLEVELDRLDQEKANLRAATEHARSTGDAVAALRIVGQLGRYAYLRGHYHEVREWMDQAVADGQAAPPAYRARALYGSGRLAHLQCDYEPAVRRLDAALLLYRTLGDDAGVAACLQALGSVAREQGRYVRSARLHAEGLELAKAAADERAEASAHSYLGFVSWLQDDLELAATECGQALTMFRVLGDVEGTAWSLISLGVVARYRNNLEAADTLLGESLELSRSIGFREGIAWCQEQLGLVALDRGDLTDAETRLLSSYATHRDLCDRWRMASVLEDLAAVVLAGAEAGTRRAERAAWLLGLSEAVREKIGAILAPCERPQHDRCVAAARTALGEAGYAAALRHGAAASDPEEFLPKKTTVPPPAQVSAGPSAERPPAPGNPERGPADSAPRTVSPPLASPLTGATPVIADLPLASPLTGATAILTGTPPRPSAAAARPGVPDPASAHAEAAGRPAGRAAPRVPAQARPADRPSGPLRVRALGRATVELGGTALTAADWGYAKPRELMFLLVSSPPMTKDQIAAALWPDLSRQQLGNALHTALRELRRALGDPGWVVYANGHYRFDRARPHECDVTEFEDALLAARRARPAQAALPHLQRAIGAYGGDFLDGVTAGEWALVRRDELRRAFESALLATGRLQTAAGRHQAAAAVFRRAVAHEPLNETAHRELMSSWARLGETARAVRHYEELTELLREQVGVPPAPETTTLYQRLVAAP
jgi:predicted ATPase/DNA-binding SARP family transcriptional activator